MPVKMRALSRGWGFKPLDVTLNLESKQKRIKTPFLEEKHLYIYIVSNRPFRCCFFEIPFVFSVYFIFAHFFGCHKLLGPPLRTSAEAWILHGTSADLGKVASQPAG